MKNPWSHTPRQFTAARTLGTGDVCFDTAVERLMTWQVQHGSGFDVEPSTRVTHGAEHVVIVRVGGLRVTAPVRIRQVVDEIDGQLQRRGFVYETRPGHPENGHESFVVERHLTSDEVRFVVTATALPGRWWVWLGAPVARIAQDVATRRYLRAIQPTSR